MTKPKLLILFIDAFRYDYPSQMPKLKKMLKNSYHGELVPDIGFAARMGTFFTGATPEEHGLYTTCYCSYRSSSLWLKPLIPLARQFSRIHPIAESLSRFAVFSLYNFVNLLRGHHYFAILKSIPYQLLPYVEIGMKKHYCEPGAFSVPNLFELIRQKNLTFHFYMWPFYFHNKKLSLDPPFGFTNNDDYRAKKFNKILNKPGNVYFVQLFNLDSIGHRHGVKSPQLKRELIHTDNMIDQIIAKFQSKHPKGSILIWTDHGMTPITKHLDINALLPKHLTPVKDYLYFIDATLFRVWPKSKQADEFFSKFSHPDITKIDQKLVDKYHLNFKQHKFGKYLFQAKSGVLFHPNFFDSAKPPKAMHGYFPQVKDEHGYYALISPRKKPKTKIHYTKDLFGLLKPLLNH